MCKLIFFDASQSDMGRMLGITPERTDELTVRFVLTEGEEEETPEAFYERVFALGKGCQEAAYLGFLVGVHASACVNEELCYSD